MTDYDREDYAYDAYLERVGDDTVGYCKTCGSRVTEHRKAGYRPYMARFAEPDEVSLTCPRCGEIDADEVKED